MTARSELERAGSVVTGKPVTANRVINSVCILLPFFDSLAILFDWPRFTPAATPFSVFAVLFVLGVMRIGIGLHRNSTHRALQTRPGLPAIG